MFSFSFLFSATFLINLTFLCFIFRPYTSIALQYSKCRTFVGIYIIRYSAHESQAKLNVKVLVQIFPEKSFISFWPRCLLFRFNFSLVRITQNPKHKISLKSEMKAIILLPKAKDFGKTKTVPWGHPLQHAHYQPLFSRHDFWWFVGDFISSAMSLWRGWWCGVSGSVNDFISLAMSLWRGWWCGASGTEQ